MEVNCCIFPAPSEFSFNKKDVLSFIFSMKFCSSPNSATLSRDNPTTSTMKST